MLQLELIPQVMDLSSKKVLIGLSGGINSAGLLCYLASEYPDEMKPKELHLLAIQLKEHSPDTFKFMKACIRYAVGKFDCIRWAVRWGSVIKFFDEENMIPHPILSPCSEHLKIIPINEYMARHRIDLDLIGYVRSERSRINRQLDRLQSRGTPDIKAHPIAHLSDDYCFYLVDREIGWHPEIYDIKDKRGKRVFHHNNCLPCKNMEGVLAGNRASKDYRNVKLYYPEYYQQAKELSDRIGSYWGRKRDFDGYCKFCELD